MRRLLWIVLALPASLAAQRPAVSPVLPRVWGVQRAQDTTLSVWLFVRPHASLSSISNRVAALGVRVRVQSRWLHAISVDAPTSALRLLAQDRDLRRIQPLGRFRLAGLNRRFIEQLPPVVRAPTLVPGDTCGVTPGDDPVLGPSEMPYRQLHLRPLTDQGVNGTGVRIGIFDTGFETTNPAFNGITITAQHDFVYKDGVVRNDNQNDTLYSASFHGTAVWSLFAGDVPGRLRGIARGATFLLAKTEDVRTETRVEEDNYVAALEWADSVGVDIISSSLAYLMFDNGFSYTPSQLNGDFAVTTVAADSAARRGILIVNAAGNSGPGSRTVWTPGDADSVLTIGAEDSLGNIAGFSSRGPTADGRIKPDFTAPGVAVCTVTDSGQVRRLDGTSFATPLLAASAALLKQLQPSLTPIGMRTALRNVANNRASPDTIRGWGRPDFGAATVFPGGVTPIAPLPSGGPLTTVTPTFSWSVGSVPPPSQPVTYRLRIAADSTLATPLVDTLLTAETFTPARALKPGSLFWQVDATAATGETATSGRIGPIPVPAWATLTALNNAAGSVSNTPLPTFTWTSPAVTSPPGPFVYDLGVQRSSNGVPVYAAAGIRDTTFTLPQPLELNVTYRWLLVVHAGGDTTRVLSDGPFLVADGGLPTATLLYQNFPNPFPVNGRNATCLWFDIATTGLVELDIVDLRGNPVRRFVPGPDFPAILEAGRYGRGTGGGSAGICDSRLMWDGRSDNGDMLPAGVYLAKLKAPGLLIFKRIVFRGK